MTNTGGGLAAAMRQAEEERKRALAILAQSVRRLDDADRLRDETLNRAGSMADEVMSLQIRGHLAAVGAKNLSAFVRNRPALVHQTSADRSAYEQTCVRLRALERYDERRVQAETREARRVVEAEWRDVVAAHSARRKS